MYPQINICKSDIPSFVIEFRPSADPSTWELYYNGNDKKAAISCITTLLTRHQNAFVTAEDGTSIKGYVFQIRGTEKTSRFFKSEEECRNPFKDRKMYDTMGKGVVSFHPIGI